MTIVKIKIFLTLVAIALFAAAFAAPVNAAAHISLYGYVEKTQYMPGEKGTLKIWVYNDGSEDVILKKIVIEYPWHSLYIWEGNETMKDINVAILEGGNWTTSRSFTVPNDGRAISGNIRVQVSTDEVSTTEFFGINVASAPYFFSLKDMEQLTTLMTILAVLTIVGIVVIAGTIFLSARRPQVTWKQEEPKSS